MAWKRGFVKREINFSNICRFDWHLEDARSSLVSYPANTMIPNGDGASSRSTSHSEPFNLFACNPAKFEFLENLINSE